MVVLYKIQPKNSAEVILEGAECLCCLCECSKLGVLGCSSTDCEQQASISCLFVRCPSDDKVISFLICRQRL